MNRTKQAVRGGLRALLVGLLAAATLSGCGGGSAQPIKPFAPTSMVAFGDETSVIMTDGRKYAVNGIGAVSNKLDCAVNPLWIQVLASHYNMVFPQCNPSNYAAAQAQTLATVGAKVDDVRQQIDGYMAGNAFTADTMVTVYAGANDILSLYGQFPGQAQATLQNLAAQAGTALGQQVIRIAKAGGRPLVVSVVDQGTTPFAAIERQTRPDVDRAALLTSLTTAFNNALYQSLGQLNDGRLMGLVFGDDLVKGMTSFPSSYGLTNVTQQACVASATLPNCSTQTLVPAATNTTWLWADGTHLGAVGHQQLGNATVVRAVNNPL